jgi:hypothetical protein
MRDWQECTACWHNLHTVPNCFTAAVMGNKVCADVSIGLLMHVTAIVITGSALLCRHWGSVQAVRPIREVESFTLSWPTALEVGEGSASRPDSSLPPGKTKYPLYRRLGGPQGRSGQVRKISPPPEFDPRTVQPVASRYTDYANRPTNNIGSVRIT